MFPIVTERLYYTDPYLAEFDASVVAVTDVDGRAGVVLDRTAFYPTSGGQPFDVGTLGAASVVDVVDRDDGTIVHVIEGEPPSGVVAGRIAWDRRFEHMQQHTGQHVLSAAFDRLFDVRTVSFHLGSTAATIDLAREVSPAEIGQAEDEANRVVWQDRPVTIRFADAADAASLPLRKESARTGQLRIVEIEDFDVSACGGTHVARTGAIGIVAVSGWERSKGGTRLEFRCGVRALRAHRGLRDVVAAATRSLSGTASELPQAIERLQAENKDLKRLIKDQDERLAGHQAEALAAAAASIGNIRVALAIVAGADAGSLKALAQAVASRPGHAAVLVGAGQPATIAIARAPDVALDAAGHVKQLVARFGGRGGGRPELAQAGGLNAAPEEIVETARQLFEVPSA
jgi:alanyl-tRNA synthetase